MTTEDSVYIPFPGIILKKEIVSMIDLNTPYEKYVTGCNRKCACRLWAQCGYYNKMRWKRLRRDEDEHMKTIWEYYNNIFKIAYDMPMVNIYG
jgi:hypothetical protein